MKLALFLTAALINAPALALTVNDRDVDAADQPARTLALHEELTVRAKLNWARLALFEIDKNERLFALVDANDSQIKRVAVGLGDSVLAGSLLAATAKLAYHEVQKDRTGADLFRGMDNGKQLNAELKQVQKDLATIDADVLKATRAYDPTLAGEMLRERQRIAKAKTYLKSEARQFNVSPAQRTVRGLKLVLAAGVAFTLAQDLGRTWIQISMTTEQVQQKRAELQNIVRDYEQQLADNAQQSK